MKIKPLILTSLMIALLVSCSNNATELSQGILPPLYERPVATEPTTTDPKPDKEELQTQYLPQETPYKQPLIDYLAKFPPLFHNIRFIDEAWASWWQSDWQDFVEVLVEERSDEWREMENHGYGYTFTFRDPLTGECVKIEDVAYLNWRSGGDWARAEIDWARAEIATNFDLFDLDGTGTPALVIYWSISPANIEPGVAVTLHRFYNGSFRFVAELSEWAGVEFYRTEDGRLFIEYISTVASWISLYLLDLDDEVTIGSVLYTDGWTGNVYNRLTGEYFTRHEWWGSFVGIYEYSHEALLSALLGEPLTRIERMGDLQEQVIELVLEQLD